MAHLVVGNPDCNFVTVVDTMESSAASQFLFESWRDLARRLGIDENEIEKLHGQLKKEMEERKGVLIRVLTTWRARQSSQATLGELVRRLEKMGLVDVAEKLRYEFYPNDSIPSVPAVVASVPRPKLQRPSPSPCLSPVPIPSDIESVPDFKKMDADSINQWAKQITKRHSPKTNSKNFFTGYKQSLVGDNGLFSVETLRVKSMEAKLTDWGRNFFEDVQTNTSSVKTKVQNWKKNKFLRPDSKTISY